MTERGDGKVPLQSPAVVISVAARLVHSLVVYGLYT